MSMCLSVCLCVCVCVRACTCVRASPGSKLAHTHTHTHTHTHAHAHTHARTHLTWMHTSMPAVCVCSADTYLFHVPWCCNCHISSISTHGGHVLLIGDRRQIVRYCFLFELCHIRRKCVVVLAILVGCITLCVSPFDKELSPM